MAWEPFENNANTPSPMPNIVLPSVVYLMLDHYKCLFPVFYYYTVSKFLKEHISYWAILNCCTWLFLNRVSDFWRRHIVFVFHVCAFPWGYDIWGVSWYRHLVLCLLGGCFILWLSFSTPGSSKCGGCGVPDSPAERGTLEIPGKKQCLAPAKYLGVCSLGRALLQVGKKMG